MDLAVRRVQIAVDAVFCGNRICPGCFVLVVNVESDLKPKSAAQSKKQIKIFLTGPEHAVAVLAANLRGCTLQDFLREAVLAAARQQVLEDEGLRDLLRK